MDENEVPEEVYRAAEEAAELMRLTTPVVQAMNQIGGISRVTGPAETAMAALRAQLTGPSRTAMAALRAQLTEPLQEALGGFRTQFTELMRPALPIILAAPWAEFDLSLQTMGAGPLQVYADQIAIARQAGMAQLAAVSMLDVPRNVTASGSITVRPTITAEGEVTNAADIGPLTPQQETPAERRLAINQTALVIILVWLVALSMPAAQLNLPPEAQAYLNTLWPMIAIALTIHLAVNDKRKH